MYDFFKKIKSSEFIRYSLVSLVSLFFDLSLYYYIFIKLSLGQKLASVIGYIFGLFVCYFLLKFFLYKDTRLKNKKTGEFALFIASGFLGTLCTYVTISSFIMIYGKENHIAKLIAIGISFFSVYLFRKNYVFKKN